MTSTPATARSGSASGLCPWHMSEPLATLARDLAATRRATLSLGDRAPHAGCSQAGSPAPPSAPKARRAALRQLGLRPGQARSTALFQLATELPAAVLDNSSRGYPAGYHGPAPQRVRTCRMPRAGGAGLSRWRRTSQTGQPTLSLRRRA